MRYLKIFGYEWLEGSIRQDLDSAGRGIWADILALGSLSRRLGYLERSAGIPYTDHELAEKFHVPQEELNKVIDICLKEGRLSVDPAHQTYFITNWNNYQDYELGSLVDMRKGTGHKIKRDSRAGRTNDTNYTKPEKL